MNIFLADMIAHGALTVGLLLLLAVLCLALLGVLIALLWALRASASYLRRLSMDAADEREALREWKAKHAGKARAVDTRHAKFGGKWTEPECEWPDHTAPAFLCSDETKEAKASKDESSFYAYERKRRPARPREPHHPPRAPHHPIQGDDSCNSAI